MDLETRYARTEEFPAVAELDGANFGFTYADDEIEEARLDLDPDRILVTVDGERLVAISAELPFTMTLPGGSQVAATGLSWVSVEVTHRRRGILRTMIEGQLRASAADGDAATILGASEGTIYGRYGFGVATQSRRVVVHRRRARLADPVDASAVRRDTTEQVRDVLPAIYERWRQLTPGAITREQRRWQLMLGDTPSQRRGRSGLFHLVHPDGYLSYRIKSSWGSLGAEHECVIVDYAPVTPEAHAALWQTLLAHDLVGRVDSELVPLDDPLPMLLTDARAVETTHLADGLWLRPVDVEQLLGRREYPVEVDCVVEVRDHLLGDGRYHLVGGPGGASCARSDRSADVSLAVADLGAVSLGGTRLAQVARTGRVRCDDPVVLARLDVALMSGRAPAQGTHF